MYDSYTSNILEVKKMSAMIHSIIQEQLGLGVKPERIILGGFSQGGALALYASLTCPVKLGGSFLLSSWLLAPWEFSGMVRPSTVHALPNCYSPMLQCHGIKDTKVRNTQIAASTQLIMSEPRQIVVFLSCRFTQTILQGLLENLFSQVKL